ncbi:DUF445 domain-containing protein [Acidaminobacter hydrogenoformans]|uniref:DUF445 domain-containing protein n=1 Tax=Acidaminobacter hydrogenoformans DSM 2784 TaxID=1120920 RepID=A0A1G5RTZ1_9FIRM|nr:DUF445 family protein [Acidaminobacter hydrogenoformans]SCZ77585.1 Protein of unknown function [Acidaminobacter hydrogenoformans DSM 2784]
MILKLTMMALIGALIGWATNWLAIKLLFRPYEPYKIPFLPLTIQGLMPKRRPQIAHSVGVTVERELVTVEEIVDKMIEDLDKDEIVRLVKMRVSEIAKQKMPSIIPGIFRELIYSYIEEAIDENAEAAITEISEKVVHRAAEKVSIGLLVEEKINEFDFRKIEEIVVEVANKELRHIEWLGGVIGLVIGLLQGSLVLFVL